MDVCVKTPCNVILYSLHICIWYTLVHKFKTEVRFQTVHVSVKFMLYLLEEWKNHNLHS